MFNSRLRAKKAVISQIQPIAEHQWLIALINSMSDSVMAVSSAGVIQLTNSAALSLFDANNLVGRNVAELMHLLDGHGHSLNIKELLRATGFNSRDYKLKYSDGSSVSLEINVSPVQTTFGASGSGFVILARDITLNKSLEEERDEFISVASHELRTPIAIAEGNISNALLLAGKSSASEVITQSLSAAHDQISFLGSLINDLSMLSRAERKGHIIEVSEIDVSQLLAELVQSHQPKASDKKVGLSFAVSPEGLKFESNELYVREILQNLITNAIKYTEKGMVDITARSSKDGVRFIIKDTGIGITSSEQRKLFTKFFRSQDIRVKKFSGTGLGLYVCAKLARLLKGRITVKSQLNKGSEFTLLLPARFSDGVDNR